MGKYLVVTFLFVLAISVPSRADTTQCITVSVPAGNVTVGFDTGCGGVNNLRIIRDIHADASGATETACDFPSELPAGWVITGFVTGSDCSRNAQASGVELYTIKNLNGLGTGDQEAVCYQSAVPAGWVVVSTSENSVDCGGNGALGTHRGFFNLNGEPQNFVKTVCTISPIPPGWVAGSPMSDPTGVCGGGTSLVQITNTNSLITFARLQASGNFAILAQPNNTQEWSNGASSQNTTDLVAMQNDGNLVEYNQSWTTGTTRSPNGFHLSTGCLPSRLLMGQTLFPGQCMASDSGRFVLAMQTQGNLVLYDSTPNPNPWTVVWWVPNNPMGNNYAVMQTDGNFVLYRQNGDGTNTALWGTMTFGPGFLWLQDDGNMNVYTAVWSTGTYNQPPGSPVLSAPCSVGELLSTASGANSTLNGGQCLLSTNSRFELSMQSTGTGRITIYDLSQNPARQIWTAP